MRASASAIVVWIYTFVCASGVRAQDQPAADRLAPQTRAAEIELEREKKAAELTPETPSPAEHAFDVVKNNKILERIVGGVTGWRARLGGLITGSGFAAGPEYDRPDLLHEQLHFRASVRGSIEKFWLSEMDLKAPHLANDHVFLDFYALHRDYPHVDYYGPGSNSAKTGRSAFTLEDTSMQMTAGVTPFDHFHVGARGRYLLVNVGPGQDKRFVSTDQIYSEATTPGIEVQTNFLESGGFVQYDWRNYPGEPRKGGNYLAEYSTFSDTERGRYSFSRLHLEVQQYFSIFNERRVLALRGRIEASDPHTGQEVPFYLQPTLGGSDDLRGFRPFRFYDNNSAVLNGEYRWEVFSGLDMALFVDAGQVYHDWHQINFRQLDTDYGFGFRFNVRNNVFMRIDTGFSREGFQVWVKFNNVF